jgi:hypothetical protein
MLKVTLSQIEQLSRAFGGASPGPTGRSSTKLSFQTGSRVLSSAFVCWNCSADDDDDEEEEEGALDRSSMDSFCRHHRIRWSPALHVSCHAR